MVVNTGMFNVVRDVPVPPNDPLQKINAGKSNVIRLFKFNVSAPPQYIRLGMLNVVANGSVIDAAALKYNNEGKDALVVPVCEYVNADKNPCILPKFITSGPATENDCCCATNKDG